MASESEYESVSYLIRAARIEALEEACRAVCQYCATGTGIAVGTTNHKTGKDSYAFCAARPIRRLIEKEKP